MSLPPGSWISGKTQLQPGERRPGALGFFSIISEIASLVPSREEEPISPVRD